VVGYFGRVILRDSINVNGVVYVYFLKLIRLQ